MGDCEGDDEMYCTESWLDGERREYAALMRPHIISYKKDPAPIISQRILSLLKWLHITRALVTTRTSSEIKWRLSGWHP
jgi:hypothetical protein